MIMFQRYLGIMLMVVIIIIVAQIR